jgi:hypothetical protein
MASPNNGWVPRTFPFKTPSFPQLTPNFEDEVLTTRLVSLALLMATLRNESAEVLASGCWEHEQCEELPHDTRAFLYTVEAYLTLACAPMLVWLREKTANRSTSTMKSKSNAYAPLVAIITGLLGDATGKFQLLRKTVAGIITLPLPIKTESVDIANVSPCELRW